MENLLKPKLYYKDIYSINYKKLKAKNIQYLLIDIDNTIGDDKEYLPCPKVVEFIKQLKEDFTIVLISNALPNRVKRYAKLIGVPYYSLSLKPLKRTYKIFLKEYKTTNNAIAAIGDQLYTDIVGANKMGITSILVDRISNNESVITKINRLRENNAIKKYKLIERGVYDE